MVFKILGIFGLIMLVPIYAMMKVASDADDDAYWEIDVTESLEEIRQKFYNIVVFVY